MKVKLRIQNFIQLCSLAHITFTVAIVDNLVRDSCVLFSCFRSTIRDKIIPHAVSWFTGEALEGEEYESDEEEDGDEDEDDEDDEEEDEDEDDDEEEDDDDEVQGRKVPSFAILSIH